MQVDLLWPNALNPMKFVYFVNKYSVIVDAVLAVACVSHPLHDHCQVLTLCFVAVGLWKPHDPQASSTEAQFSQRSTHLTSYILGMQDAIHGLSL